jgi:Flp pilus assembly protein TadG
MRTVPRSHSARRTAQPRRGAILVLSAFMLILILAFAAFTVDVGWITLAKAQLQNAADSGAMAAALELGSLGDDPEAEQIARQAASDMAALHRVGEQDSLVLDPDADVLLGRRVWNSGSGTYSFEWGPTAKPYNCVKVTARREQIAGGADRRLPLFLAPVIGHEHASVAESAIATFQIRDMMLVLDYSSSMNDDSEYSAFASLGQAAVEENIQQIWEDLGSPVYGDLPYEPDWATLSGQPASGPIPHIEVTYKGHEVFVESTKDLSNIVLKFSDGSTQKFEGLSGQTGTFKGTGSKSGKRVVTAWVKSGTNDSGDGPGYGERFDFNTARIKDALGLDNVSYPYAVGSWDEYIQYYAMGTSYPSLTNGNYEAGYRDKFGMESLINYWNEWRPLASQTDSLWQTRQQPITALKDATDLLLDYLIEVEAEDAVGLSVYTYPGSEGAKLESELTTDYNTVKDISRQRQAGHYDHYTNIGAGIRNARLELEQNARPAALKMIVLMTDGQANQSLTSASPQNFALNEAILCEQAGIKINTISLGTGADPVLMQNIADLTGGEHFNVPGGSSVAEYDAQLKEVFREIAADRPLMLIREP